MFRARSAVAVLTVAVTTVVVTCLMSTAALAICMPTGAPIP
ncbi:hypothetical protein [Streptomyces sp. XD-27]|nr:hypothetical protein [Streptomyces sp. XD-27]WKX68799.1 hypothetical protein Q3Y56_01645 [Streptomyces sp. XD-27]